MVVQIVNDILEIIGIDLNLFNIEYTYRRSSNHNLEAPKMVVEFSLKQNRDEFIKYYTIISISIWVL